MWQESLIGSIVPPHGSYQSSSSLSPAASSLSLGSSQPFEATANDLDEDVERDFSLKSFKEFNQLHGETDEALFAKSQTFTKVEEKGIIGAESVSNISLNKLDLSHDVQKDSGVTPRLPLGRIVKARDLDSGCPGSERSTKVSQNASLEIVEQQINASDIHPEISDEKLPGKRECSGNSGENKALPSPLLLENRNDSDTREIHFTKEKGSKEGTKEFPQKACSSKGERSPGKKSSSSPQGNDIDVVIPGKARYKSKGNFRSEHMSADSSRKDTRSREQCRNFEALPSKRVSSGHKSTPHFDVEAPSLSRKAASSPHRKSKGLNPKKYDEKIYE